MISYTKSGKDTINSYGVVTNVVNTVGTLGRVYIKPYGSFLPLLSVFNVILRTQLHSMSI